MESYVVDIIPYATKNPYVLISPYHESSCMGTTAPDAAIPRAKPRNVFVDPIGQSYPSTSLLKHTVVKPRDSEDLFEDRLIGDVDPIDDDEVMSVDVTEMSSGNGGDEQTVHGW